MAITKDKAEIIAAAYIEAGCNKEAGMKAANYADSSLKSGKVKRVVYHNILVRQAIDRITAKNRFEADVRQEELISALRQLAGLDDGAVNLNNAERLRSIELLGKFKGLWNADKAQAVDQPEQLTKDQLAQLKDLAKAATSRKDLKIHRIG